MFLIKTFAIHQKNSGKQHKWITGVVDECLSVNCVINKTSGIITTPSPYLINIQMSWRKSYNHYCYHFIIGTQVVVQQRLRPAASSHGGTAQAPKMEHNRRIRNVARHSAPRNQRLFSLNKSLAVIVGDDCTGWRPSWGYYLFPCWWTGSSHCSQASRGSPGNTGMSSATL